MTLVSKWLELEFFSDGDVSIDGMLDPNVALHAYWQAVWHLKVVDEECAAGCARWGSSDLFGRNRMRLKNWVTVS